MIEIEKTYLAKEIPVDLAKYDSYEIVDLYFPKDDPDRALRLRKKGEEYELVKKKPVGEDVSIQKEEVIRLTADEYLVLATSLDCLEVRKRRFLYTKNDTVAEIDVFGGGLQGLVLIDYEFENEDDMNNFSPPEYCLVEVTQEKFIAGGTLAGKSYEDMQNKLNTFKYIKLDKGN